PWCRCSPARSAPSRRCRRHIPTPRAVRRGRAGTPHHAPEAAPCEDCRLPALGPCRRGCRCDPHAAQQCQPRRFHRQGSSFGVTLQVNLTRANMLLDDLVQTSKRVAQTSSRRAKIDLLAALLKRATPAEIETAIAFLPGGP